MRKGQRVEVSRHALRYFLALADELHFGRAAERLHITAPSLSQQITRLETAVGVALFERTSRRVELTDAGLELIPLARSVVDAHQSVDAWALQRQRAESPLLRLGFVVGLGAPLTTRMIVAASEAIPELRIELQRLDFSQQFSALREGRVDVVLLPDASGGLPADLIGTEVLTEPRVLVTALSHPLAGRESVSLDETNGETYVSIAGPDDSAVNAWLVNPRPDGTRLTLGPRADDIEAILELCAAGLGVNIAGASVRELYPRGGLAYIPIDGLAPSRLVICSLRATNNPTVALFGDIVRRLAQRGAQLS